MRGGQIPRGDKFSEYLRKWLLVSALIGFMTGLLVTTYELIINEYLLEGAFHFPGNWHGVFDLYSTLPLLGLILTVLGITLAGIVRHLKTDREQIQMADEVIVAYNQRYGEMEERYFLPKYLASILTLGLGGAAGLEGPSMYVGAVPASWLWRRLKVRLSLEDRRVMVLAGAAAGISAIFKAPLTGTIFALEVPYKDDLAHEALIPSLLSSVVSYVTLVVLTPTHTTSLFNFPPASSFNYSDIFFSTLLGIAVGILVRAFVALHRRVEQSFLKLKAPFYWRGILAGLGLGILGILSLRMFGYPYAIGPGYRVITDVSAGIFQAAGLPLAAALLLLLLIRMFATSLTLGTDRGISGIFIPLIVMGAAVGGAFRVAIGATGPVILVAAGMAAFLAGGYKSPLAATAFVAETTGSPAYLIPGFIAAALSYVISGDKSVSQHQELRERIEIRELEGMTVKDVMTLDVVSVPAQMSLQDFVDEYLLTHRHTNFPVTDHGRLVGTISMNDLSKVSKDRWSQTRVLEAANTNPIIADEAESLSVAMDKLYGAKRGGIPVVETGNHSHVIGIVSKTDILRALELRRNPLRS